MLAHLQRDKCYIKTSKRSLRTLILGLTDLQEFLQRAFKPVYTPRIAQPQQICESFFLAEASPGDSSPPPPNSCPSPLSLPPAQQAGHRHEMLTFVEHEILTSFD